MTHRICWLTDIHLDHLREIEAYGTFMAESVISKSKVRLFCEMVMDKKPDSVVITGDISQANSITTHLMWLEEYLPNIPIYFVLGNHDYFQGSISNVRTQVAQQFNGNNSRIQWLNVGGVIRLTNATALVGHDGWYDGGYSDWFKSKLMMNDYFLIKEFRMQPPIKLFEKIRELAQECADHILDKVQEAAESGYSRVVFATHVPPFQENSRAPDMRQSDKDWLPNMSSKKAGDALLLVAKAFRKVDFLSLCGHTHTPWIQKYASNLTCYTGQAAYGNPELSIKIIEVD